MEHILMIKKNKIHHQTYLSLYVFKEKKNAIQNQAAHAVFKTHQICTYVYEYLEFCFYIHK